MKTIIAGTREITDYALVCDAIQEGIEALGIEITEVVCGMAPGVDILGKKWAEENGIIVEKMHADWNRWGRSYAGIERNRRMALYGDALIAIWSDQSRGTENMIKQAKFRGLKVYIKKIAIDV